MPLSHGPILDRTSLTISRSGANLDGSLVVKRVKELITSVSFHVSLKVLANVALVYIHSALLLLVSGFIWIPAVHGYVTLIARDKGSASCSASS